MGLPADAVGPIEWWDPKRLKPYEPRHVQLPSFRDTPSWEMLRRLIQESGIREPLLVLPDGQVVDGVHRLELARALKLSAVPVRVITMPEPLDNTDRLRLDTTIAALAVGRRHVDPARVQGLLFALTQAELEVGVVNSRVANLRRGWSPGPGAQGPTQRAMAESRGVSDRTVRRLIRIGREGSEALQAAVAAGDISVKAADRRLGTGTNGCRVPNGPAALQDTPMAAIGAADEPSPAQGTVATDGDVNGTARAQLRTLRPARRETAADPGARAPAPSRIEQSHPRGPASTAGERTLSVRVQAFLDCCREMDAITREFRRATARWSGEHRARAQMTMQQAVRQLTEQLEWMQAAEATRHGTSPS